jgi:hypothetical protein
VVRVASVNRDGLSFWRRTIARYTAGRFVEEGPAGMPRDWRVFTFESADDRPGRSS